MDYKNEFIRITKSMDTDFNWTTKLDLELINNLIKNEISEKHELFNKEIIPIAIAKNKYDLLGYYKEMDDNIFVTIHFKGYKTDVDVSPYFEKYNSLESAIMMIIKMYNELYVQNRYNIMIESEEIKKQKSYYILNGLYSKMPLIYDCLFKINEYRGKLADIDNKDLLIIQNLFQFYAYDFSYKIRSIFTLSEIGNYADAAIILRSLTETFFYFKYYIVKNDGKGMDEYVMQSKKHGIKIKDIMEKIAPTYYDTIYDELCKLTHGNPLMVGLFRGNVSKEDRLKHSMYNINLDWFSYILNLTLPLINGYFEMFKKVYPNNTLHTSKRLTNNMKIVKDFINKDLKDRYNTHEKQRPMIELYKKIISFS